MNRNEALTFDDLPKLDSISKVRRLLDSEPIEGRLLAEQAGLTVEQCYAALVWLYDRGLALISRQARTGKINGWIAA